MASIPLTPDLAAYLRKCGIDPKPKLSKYHNESLIVDGWRFDSRKEAARYAELKLEVQSGNAKWFVRQVPFHLPGGIVYKADFVVVWDDGRVTVEDVKGVRTKEYKLKKRLMREFYDEVEIREI